MKAPLTLDRDDHRALAALASWGLLMAGTVLALLLSILLLALVLGLALRIFMAVSGLGAP